MTQQDLLFLRKHTACTDGVAFADRCGGVAEAWDALCRGEGELSWLLWLIHRAEVPPTDVVRGILNGARTMRMYTGEAPIDKLTDAALRHALTVTEQYVAGKVDGATAVTCLRDAASHLSALLAPPQMLPLSGRCMAVLCYEVLHVALYARAPVGGLAHMLELLVTAAGEGDAVDTQLREIVKQHIHNPFRQSQKKETQTCPTAP